MRHRARGLVLLVGVLLLAAGAFAQWKPVNLDPVHSRIGFTAATLLFDVDGHFRKYELQLNGDPAKPTQAKVKLAIDASSIDTGNSTRDEHLASADFLDVKTFPKIVFTSESISQTGNVLNISGTLELHGHKKKITLPFKMTKGKNGAGTDTTAFKAKLSINRNDFGVGAGNVAAKISLEDEVALDLLIVSFL